MTTSINAYKEMTGIYIWNNVVYSEKSVEELTEYCENHWFIIIDWVSYNKSKIDEMRKITLDELKSFIYSQSEEIKNKLIEKQYWLKSSMWKEMTLSYAQNFVNNLVNNNK